MSEKSGYEIAQERIAEVERTGKTNLNLSDLKLESLPPDLRKLTNLTSLSLSGNKLTSLPVEFSQLINLTSLYLGRNQFSSVPIEICQLANLTSLSLSSNQFISLPAEIGQLAHLTRLDISGNRLIRLPVEISRLAHLTSLDLSFNQLTELPIEIWQLTNLTRLVLSRNKLLGLQSEIAALVNLISLNLADQPVKLPAEIWQLTSLISLDIGFTRLVSLPSEVGQLINLTILNLSNNELISLPAEIGQLAKLSTLDLSNNELTSLPAEIWKLTSLTKLHLSSNRLTCLPSEIAELSNLTNLEISRNRLDSLPSEIGKLNNLTNIDLSNNRISSIPAEICQLTSLTRLWLAKNEMTTLPAEIGACANLSVLELRSNRLIRLPVEIVQLKNLKSLDLKDNPLNVPTEILKKIEQPQFILDYLAWFWDGKPRPLSETKLLVLGQGSVGKTSLVKRLTSSEFNPHENKTDGIAINCWQVPDQFNVENQQSEIRVNIWDFGGQEIMHATHQFFLTHRSLYLLVLDSRQTPEENHIDYWLKIIQSFGGNSPVIVVGNKSDQHPLDLDRAGLREKYPQIVAILETSAATGAGMEELKKAITQQVNTLPHVRDQIPETWFNVKTALEELGRAQNFISEEKFAETCAAHEINETGSQRTLLGFLHDLGVLLHFQGDPRLESLGILNPVWVTDGVYKILNAPALFQAQGILPLSMLADILPPGDYPRNKHLFLIDLMKRFELCFALEPDKTFLLPDLLLKQAPATGDWDDALTFIYEYPVLPTSVMTRFIVRMNAHIAENLVWRTGVVLQLDANRALLKADPNENRLTIRVSGPEHTRREALAVIRHQLETIHASMKGLIPERKIPVPGHLGIEPLRYEYLLELERDGIPILPVFDGQRNIKVDVKQLLNGIESEDVRRMTYVAISGSVGGSVVVGDGNTVETGK